MFLYFDTSTSPWHIRMIITYNDFSISVAVGTSMLRNEDMAMAIPKTLKFSLCFAKLTIFVKSGTPRRYDQFV